MAEVEEREVFVRRREPRSTIVPNIIFAICMVAFIAFVFWEFGMRRSSPVDLTENYRAAPAAAPDSRPN